MLGRSQIPTEEIKKKRKYWSHSPKKMHISDVDITEQGFHENSAGNVRLCEGGVNLERSGENSYWIMTWRDVMSVFVIVYRACVFQTCLKIYKQDKL